MHRITHKGTASQGKKSQNIDPAGTILPFPDDFQGNTLVDLNETAYAQITQPQRVVVLPRYFVNHWLPLLGPSPAWLVLAFRQAAFVVRCPEKESIQPISVRDLTRWSGLSHGQIWNLLTQLPVFLDWFVRKIAEPQSARQSTTWGVQTTIPVAPHHLKAIHDHIQAHASLDQSPVDYLRSLLSNLPAILWGCSPEPGTPFQQATTVHQLIEARFGPQSAEVSTLCDEVTARIVQPGNTIAITHYFIDRWRNVLKSGEAWLVQLLRTQVYAAREFHASTHIEGGKTRLAAMLNVTPRSVRRWFSDLATTPLGTFITVQNDAATNENLELHIILRDPIHPVDQNDYRERIQKFTTGNGQNWTVIRTKLDSQENNAENRDGQNWTEGRTLLDSNPDKNEHIYGQNRTAPRKKLDTVIDSSIESKPIKEIDHQLPLDLRGDKVGGWDIDRILQLGGIKAKKRSQIQEQFVQEPQLKMQFIGWLLYGYEHKQTEAGRGIASPVLFALSRYAHSRPAPLYLSLAHNSPAELHEELTNPMNLGQPADRRNVITNLQKVGFERLLDEMITNAPQKTNLPEHVPMPALGGEVFSAQMQKPLQTHATSAFPSTASQLWQALKKIPELSLPAEVVSMWLNGTELELSLMQTQQAQETIDQLKTYFPIIQSQYPGCAIRVRLLGIGEVNRSGVPMVQVVETIQIS